MIVHEGACHCGALKLSLQTGKSASELGARACGCSFCSAHGASWTSDPDGTVRITAGGPFSRYRFGTSSAEFLVCAVCGVVPAVVWQSPEGLLGVVRVESLAARDHLTAHRRATDFDSEDLTQRLARRSRTWTPAILTAVS